MLIRTIIFYILLSFWTIFLGILCLPFLVLPNKYIRFPALGWIKGIFILLNKICKITHEIRGLENIPAEPIVIVSKHQSAFETFALFYYLKKSFFIHKKQLFLIPIFGQYLMKSNMLAIDRKGGAKTMRKILLEIKKRLDDGSSIIIFPEGTRKRPGDLPDYKTGFIGIYNEVRRKILPIALNSGLCWPKHTFVMKKGHIIIDVLPHIESNLQKHEVLKNVKNTIENATNKLIK
tara:strand:- start:395 stop:1096 length:702 start_codon:yes stop_codon:yes gene_type:complete